MATFESLLCGRVRGHKKQINTLQREHDRLSSPGQLAPIVGMQHGRHRRVHLRQPLMQLGSSQFLQLRLPVLSAVSYVRRSVTFLLRDAANVSGASPKMMNRLCGNNDLDSLRYPAGPSTAETRCSSWFLLRRLAACFCCACHLCSER